MDEEAPERQHTALALHETSRQTSGHRHQTIETGNGESSAHDKRHQENRYITDDEEENRAAAASRREKNRIPITHAQMSQLQDSGVALATQGRSTGPALATSPELQIRSEEGLLGRTPPLVSPKNAQFAIHQANMIAQGLPTRVGRRSGIPGVGFSVQDNVYFGQPPASKYKIRAVHRRHGTELPNIIVKHNPEENSIANTQNNSTVSSLHKELMIRRPIKKQSQKPNTLNHSINVGGGHVSDLFFANRTAEIQAYMSTSKVDKSSIEDSSNHQTDRTAIIGNTSSGQQLAYSSKKPKVEGRVPFNTYQHQLVARKKVKSTVGNMKFIASNTMATNLAPVHIRLKNDSQMLKQTQSLFRSPQIMLTDQNRARYDSSSSSGKIGHGITDSNASNVRHFHPGAEHPSVLRVASAQKKAACPTHHLVSARNRSSKLKWKEFQHNCNNMRILESNRKIHESRILSGQGPKDNNRMRQLLVDQVGYGQATGGQADKQMQELYTSRSGGKEAGTARSGGKDSNSESVHFQTMLDQKIIAPRGLLPGDSRYLQDSAVSRVLSSKPQMTPHYSEKSAIPALKIVTPPPLDLRKGTAGKDHLQEDSVVIQDSNVDPLTDRSIQRQPIVPQELRSGIGLGDQHSNQQQKVYTQPTSMIHSQSKEASANGSQGRIIDTGNEQIGGGDLTQERNSQEGLNQVVTEQDEAADVEGKGLQRQNSAQRQNAQSKTPIVGKRRAVNEDVTQDDTRPEHHNMVFSETMGAGEQVLSHDAEKHGEYPKTFNPASTTSTNHDYSKGRKSSQVQGLSSNRHGPGQVPLLSSSFHVDKRTSIVDFHCQREEILSGRYKGSDLPSVLGRKDELLKIQMRQNMTGYEPRRKPSRFTGHKNVKSPISINESVRIDEPAIPILGLLDSKRGSNFPKRASQQQIDFSYPNRTLQELKHSSVSPDHHLRSSVGSPHLVGRVLHNLSKISKYQKKQPFGLIDSMWIPNADNVWANDGPSNFWLQKNFMKARPGSLVTKAAVSPSQKKRSSAMQRSTDKPGFLLPDIGRGQGEGDEALRRSPSLQDVPHAQSSLNALTNPTQNNQSGLPGSLRYTSQRDGFSGTDVESKDRAIHDGDKERVEFSETRRNEHEAPDLEEVQEAWQQELQNEVKEKPSKPLEEPRNSALSAIEVSQQKKEVNQTKGDIKASKPKGGSKQKKRQIDVDKEADAAEPLNIEIEGAFQSKKKKGKAAAKKANQKDGVSEMMKPKEKAGTAKKPKGKKENEDSDSVKVVSALRGSDSVKSGKSKGSVRILLDDQDSAKKKNQSTILEASGGYTLVDNKFQDDGQQSQADNKVTFNDDSEKAKDSSSKKKSAKSASKKSKSEPKGKEGGSAAKAKPGKKEKDTESVKSGKKSDKSSQKSTKAKAPKAKEAKLAKQATTKEAKPAAQAPKGKGKGPKKSILKAKGKAPSDHSDAPLSAGLSERSPDSGRSERDRSRKASQESRESQEVAPNTYWDTGCDPIDFFSARAIYGPGVGDSLGSDENTPRQPATSRMKDWARSRCLKLVMELRALPRQDRVPRARLLEQIYLNPREIDIFTEEEATYNAHILKQRYETQRLGGQPGTDYQFYLYEIDQKARRTIQVLTNFMLLGKHAHKDILDLLRDENLFIATLDDAVRPAAIFQDYRDGIAVRTPTVRALHHEYQAAPAEDEEQEHNPLPLAVADIKKSPLKQSFEKLRVDVDHNNVVKLLLRVRGLYQTLQEIIQILELIVQQREMFTSPESLLNQMVVGFLQHDQKPTDVQKKSGDNTPEKVLVKGQQVLLRLSRRIAHFLSDHKPYKTFLFLGTNYQHTIMKCSKILARLLRLHLNHKRATASGMYQNPSWNREGDFLEFGNEKVDVNISEPVAEQLALFKKVQYFTGDTEFLPFLNPEYGSGRYDGRFNNAEFFKDRISVKLRNFLAKKTREVAKAAMARKAQASILKAAQQSVPADEGRPDGGEVQGAVNMFNIDYEAGSNAILSSYVEKHGQSQNVEQQLQPLQKAQRARLCSRDVERKPQKDADPSEQFEDAFQEFNAHYEASMIDHATFKDSQSKIMTVGSVNPLSGRIKASSGVLSDGQRTVARGATGPDITRPGRGLKPGEKKESGQDAQLLDRQIAQMQKDGLANKVTLLELASSSADARTQNAAKFQSATYAAQPVKRVPAVGHVLSTDQRDVVQASGSRHSLANPSSQKTADLGQKMGTQGINVGVKGRVVPERPGTYDANASAGGNIFSAGSLHKMNSNQMMDLQEEMQDALRSEAGDAAHEKPTSLRSGDVQALGQSLHSDESDTENGQQQRAAAILSEGAEQDEIKVQEGDPDGRVDHESAEAAARSKSKDE